MGQLTNILLVDDDKLFVFLTKKTIEITNLPTRITEFGDGLDAISFLKAHADDKSALPDIIFLDISMPIMDGWEFLEEYEQIEAQFEKKIKLYMFSSSISPHDMERAKQFSAVLDFIIKPLSKEKITELLNS